MNSGLIQQIGRETAAPFIEQWHYLHTVPTGKNIFFGRYDDDQTPYAVANYGIGVNNYQEAYLGRHTGYDVTPDTLLELKRMCRREPKQETMPLTRFLKICHHALKKQGVRFIIAFSDPEQGHNGGIYKAANFTYLGKTNSERHLVDTDGTLVHRRRVLRYMERHTLTAASARRQLGLTIIKTMSKERWFLALNGEARGAKEQMPSRTSLGQDRDRRLERDLQVMVFASGTPSPASGGHVEGTRLVWRGLRFDETSLSVLEDAFPQLRDNDRMRRSRHAECNEAGFPNPVLENRDINRTCHVRFGGCNVSLGVRVPLAP